MYLINATLFEHVANPAVVSLQGLVKAYNGQLVQ